MPCWVAPPAVRGGSRSFLLGCACGGRGPSSLCSPGGSEWTLPASRAARRRGSRKRADPGCVLQTLLGHRASSQAHGERSLEGAAAPSHARENQLKCDGLTRGNCRKAASIDGSDPPIIQAFCNRDDDHIDVAYLGIPMVDDDLRSAGGPRAPSDARARVSACSAAGVRKSSRVQTQAGSLSQRAASNCRRACSLSRHRDDRARALMRAPARACARVEPR